MDSKKTGTEELYLPTITSFGVGAIVGASSVVTKDILPFEIRVGNPARFIRKRENYIN